MSEPMMLDIGFSADNDSTCRVIDIDADRDLPLGREQIEAFCRKGYLSARITGRALDIPSGSEEAGRLLAWLACLRDFSACSVPVEWQAAPSLAQLSTRLLHIAPPENDLPIFEGWHRLHRPGLCFWRSGPGFALIVDRRTDGDANEYMLDTPEYLDVFLGAQTPASRETLSAISSDAVESLEAEGLILSIQGWSLALPFRMRHWPVPFMAI